MQVLGGQLLREQPFGDVNPGLSADFHVHPATPVTRPISAEKPVGPVMNQFVEGRTGEHAFHVRPTLLADETFTQKIVEVVQADVQHYPPEIGHRTALRGLSGHVPGCIDDLVQDSVHVVAQGAYPSPR